LERETASTGAEAASTSGGLERKTASTGAEAASTSGGLERKSQSKASVDNVDSLCKVGICPICNKEYDADELLSECFGMNPNVSAINDGSADNDDDAFYKENALFGDDSSKDLDLEELVVDDMMPKKGRGGGCKLSPGGPPPPDTDGFTEQEAEAALKQWRWDRKKYVDKICRAKRKAKSSMRESLAKFEGDYTGVCMDLLRPMTKVALFPLMEGHTFPNKEILLMRIAKEANILGVQVGIKRSDQFQLVVKGLKGKHFHVQGTCGDKTGWKVSTCITRETPVEASVAKPAPELPPDEGYVEEGNSDDDSVKKKSLRDRTPIKLRWLVPLIQSIISERPNVSNKELKELLKLYVKDIFLTASVLQNTRSDARATLFGNVDKNVQYVDVLVGWVKAAGHDVLVITHPAKEVRRMLDCVIISEQMKKLKAKGKTMSREEKINFVKDWKEENVEMLAQGRLGPLSFGEEEPKIFTGVFFSTMPARTVVPLLQTAYQANAAHMNFGKYSVFVLWYYR
jgi:hypothetical protein